MSIPFIYDAAARALRAEFLLNPAVVFLNHGSFGATPQPVMAAYQAWQLELEREPVYFWTERLQPALTAARRPLAEFLNAPADDIVYLPNATFATNVVARSLCARLEPGDEVLLSDHEYGACERVWEFLAPRHGLEIRRQPLPLGQLSEDDLVERLWAGVTSRTRILFLSHITSSTAVRFPVAALCRRARDAGILTVIDGAHAPGQIPLDLAALDADFYLGNLHKWVCSPKGSAFLYAAPRVQPLIEPLLVGWGWGAAREVDFGSDFLDYLQLWGTNDYAAYLAVPAALDFLAAQTWEAVRERCRALLWETLTAVNTLTGFPAVYTTPDQIAQMGVARLPKQVNGQQLKQQLYTRYQIQVPVTTWGGEKFVRISVQGYTTGAECQRLVEALEELGVGG